MNRIWSLAGKIAGGLFLFAGGTVATSILVGIYLSHATGGALALLSMLLIMFGLSPILLGGWLLHISLKFDRQFLRDRFFQLVQNNRGRLSLLDFATATRLEPAIARHHLDQWAKEFSANFEVTDAGEIYYVFATEPMLLSGNSGSSILSQFIRQWAQSL